MPGLTQIHQFNVFSVSTPLQEAVAIAFEQAPAHRYHEGIVRSTCLRAAPPVPNSRKKKRA